MPLRTKIARRVATGAITAGLIASTAVAVAPNALAIDAGVGRYTPITPTRVLDSRNTGGPLGAGQFRTVDLSSAIGTTASAAVINFTVVTPTESGYQSVGPAGQSDSDLKASSVMNILAGKTRANEITVGVTNGQIKIYNNQGSSNVIVDVLGWYSATANASGTDYFPLSSPSRLFDTRSPGSFNATSPVHSMDTGQYSTLVVSVDYGTDINKTIKALALNVTVTNTAGLGYLTLWDGSGSLPATSAINWVAGQTIANTINVPVRCADASCSTLTFSIRNAVSPSTDVLADVVGQYATPASGGLVYLPRNPTRITDTRSNTPFGKLGPAASGKTNVRAVGGMDPTAGAIIVNVTAIVPTSTSFVALYPNPGAGGAPPLVSTLNVAPYETAPNGAQVTLAQDGTITSYNNAGSLDLAIDLQGQFLRDPQF